MRTWPLAALAGSALVSGAQASAKPYTITPQIWLVSDYRFRGVTYSDNDPALQGSINADGPWGLSAGAWGSTTSSRNNAGAAEIDFYLTKSVEVRKTRLSAGAVTYLYPGAAALAYGELTAVAARAIGPVDVAVGANYAWPQASTGRRDNIYAYANLAAPIAKVRKTAISLGAGAGYEQGAYFNAEKFDWKFNVTATWKKFDFSVGYVDSNWRSSRARPRAVFSVSRAF